MRYSTIILSLSLCATAVAQSPCTFALTGSMSTARAGHTATLLTNGKVLISGGRVSSGPAAVPTNTADIYDPATATFSATGAMNVARMWHSATLLPDGRVLIAGGEPPDSYVTASAEIYDPSTGLFSSTGPMAQGLDCHQATLLGNGQVLITGGSSQTVAASVPQLYDPVAGKFTSAGAYANYPGEQTNTCEGARSTLLADGTVLLVWENDGSEIYDPVAGWFRKQSSALPFEFGDGMPTVNLLMNGRVLIAGGMSDLGLNSGAVLYDPSSETFTPTASITRPHAYAASSLLPDGSVLIAGSSWGGTTVTPDVDLFDPNSATFVAGANMFVPRSLHTATLLPNGEVLIAGGITSAYGFPPTASAEVYYPNVLAPAPILYSVPGATLTQGAILHAGTSRLVTASDPAVPGEAIEIYGTGLNAGGVIPPQVSIGGRLAQVLFFGDAPGYPGLNQVNVLTPAGVASGGTVPVWWNYMGRPSNAVTIAVQASDK